MHPVMCRGKCKGDATRTMLIVELERMCHHKGISISGLQMRCVRYYFLKHVEKYLTVELNRSKKYINNGSSSF